MFKKILLFILCFTLITGCSSASKEEMQIIKYELKTSEYFSNINGIKKYVIDSTSELNIFYSLYSNKINIDKKYLDNNLIFIQVEQVSSGSISKKLKDVVIDNDVMFIIDTEVPEVGTCDMALWYFVAIVPKERVKEIDLTNWLKPSSELDSI